MKNIIILFLFLTSFFSSSSECQDFSYPLWIKNKKINYSIVFIGADLDLDKNSIKPSKYIVLIDFSKRQKKYLKSLSIKEWECLLKCEKTNFSTNLILYSIFEKGASLLLDTDKNEWNNCCQDDDIEYWIDYLSNNKEDLTKKLNEFFK